MKMNLPTMQLLALMGKLIGAGPQPKQEGKGVRLARERLAAKRKRNEEMSKSWPVRPPSRQVVRATARRIAKDQRSARKVQAGKDKVKGGSATVA